MIHIAFAGFRHDHIASLYYEATQKDDVIITGCYEEDTLAEKEASEKYGAQFKYSNYDAILQDPYVEVVAIGDYYAKRGSMIIEALQHGKHVICDKPLCTEPDEINQIEELSHQKNLKVMCMLDLRYKPQIAKAKEILESGILGDIHIASFTGQHFLDYGKRPGWYFEPGKHGGTINDIGIHGVDLIRYLIGKDLTAIHCARIWNAFAQNEPDFSDCGQFMVQMENLALMADVSYAAPKMGGGLPTYWNFYFWGSKGMLNFSVNDSQLHIYTDREEIVECPPNDHSYLDDLAKEIRGERTIMSICNILESQRQTLKIQKAADAGSQRREVKK